MTIVAAPTANLAALATAIANEHELATQHAASALEHAQAAGDLLRVAKAGVPHGAWERWVSDACGFSVRTGQKYMQLAAGRAELAAKAPTSALLGIEQAAVMLATPRPRQPLVPKPSVSTARGEITPVAAAPTAGRATLNRTNDNVDWAWWTWNPVTGCLHDCPYCYARDIAERFYPQGFVPTFHADRLDAPGNTKPPTSDDPRARRVFTCSMADLFGKWVPQDWIDAVFARVRDHQEWEFLFLTKFPQRLAELDWPDNAWVGTTVDRQHRVEIAERAFRGVKAGVTWLSCEPLLEPLRFTSLDMFDLVVIGGASRSTQTPEFWPPYEWVADLERQARAAGCAVYFKANALSSNTPVPKELPRTRGEGT